METETRYDFRLNFLTNRQEIMTLNIPHADPDLLGSEINDAMLVIMNTGIVESTRGEPIFRQSAELVRTERKDYRIR